MSALIKKADPGGRGVEVERSGLVSRGHLNRETSQKRREADFRQGRFTQDLQDYSTPALKQRVGALSISMRAMK